MKEKAPVAMTYTDGIAWGNAWVVLKGSPHAKLAHGSDQLRDLRRSAEAPAGLSAPTGRSLSAAAAKGNAGAAEDDGHGARERQGMLIINEEQAALYSAKYEAEWNRFQLG